MCRLACYTRCNVTFSHLRPTRQLITKLNSVVTITYHEGIRVATKILQRFWELQLWNKCKVGWIFEFDPKGYHVFWLQDKNTLIVLCVLTMSLVSKNQNVRPGNKWEYLKKMNFRLSHMPYISNSFTKFINFIFLRHGELFLTSST